VAVATTIVGAVALILVVPLCTHLALALTCQPYEVDSFKDGEWVLRSESKGLARISSLYRRGNKEPAERSDQEIEQDGEFVFFLVDDGTFAVLDLHTDELRTFQWLDDAPREWRKQLTRLH